MRPIRSMAFVSRVSVLLILALMVSLLAVGCQPKSPEEQVADARSRYVVELQTFFPKVDETEAVDMADEAPSEDSEAVDGEADATPADDDAEATDGEAADGEGGEGEAADGEAAEAVEAEPAAPATQTMFFDLVVFLDGATSLPGLTLEITLADSAGTEKANWRRYVELPAMVKGETQQVSFEEEVEGFVEGDVFAVGIRSVVPAEERGEYREFAEFSAGG